MISLISKCLVFILVLYSGIISAGEVPSLSWIAPVEREDGTPLAKTEIAQYNLYFNDPVQGLIPHMEFSVWGTKEGNPYMAWYEAKPKPHCYKMTTVDTEERESLMSPLVCIDYQNPNQPTVICQ